VGVIETEGTPAAETEGRVVGMIGDLTGVMEPGGRTAGTVGIAASDRAAEKEEAEESGTAVVRGAGAGAGAGAEAEAVAGIKLGKERGMERRATAKIQRGLKKEKRRKKVKLFRQSMMQHTPLLLRRV